jgi:aryl-alcohol dehydrogenase-like predicted oxidoreductase
VPANPTESRSAFPQRTLGKSGLLVSAIGLGCMGMSELYGAPDEVEALATIRRALDLGLNFLDTADAYGRGHNEELVGRALRGRREQAVLATKFGNLRSDDGRWIGVNGRPEYALQCCDASLKRLGVAQIDLYYLHRVDPEVPIEDTVGAMARLVEQGKVLHLGLSEAAPLPCIPLRRCRPSIPCGRAIPRWKSSPRVASWESASSPTARWAAVF